MLQQCSAKFMLLDVGARWGVSDRWASIQQCADVLCFEPDPTECARLNQNRPANVRYLPFGLADEEAERDLFMTLEPACSSLHEPIAELYENYPPLAITRPERTIKVPCKRLDDVLLAERVSQVSVIKLDTQGSEISILKGATNALSTCNIIDIEVEFNPIYGGQGLFSDVDIFLREKGFVLWRLENLVHYAPECVPAAASGFSLHAEPNPAAFLKGGNGQIFWAQAQYVRASFPRTGAQKMDLEVALPAAVLAAVYGFWDLSLELVRKTGDASLLASIRRELGLEP